MFLTTVMGAAFIWLAPDVAWYINLPFLLVVAVFFFTGAASKKKYVRYVTFAYVLFFDVVAPWEVSREDGWTWVVWVDMVILLVVTVLAAAFVKTGLEDGSDTRPAPVPTMARDRPFQAPRRHPARVAALRRQAQRSASRRR
ncbi:hypothetical protein [Streptomyces sp. NPDC059639]|uniref:hypothetical protein n=1 Tax=Streptomyces sp. NPDC059639 TaxID=3346891 RepID=UPI0036900BF9